MSPPTTSPTPSAETRGVFERFLPAPGASTDAIFEAFMAAVGARGVELYEAQEQAVLELLAGKHVILNTPTGSGKSLVASALMLQACAEGKRLFYTAPTKALVSEKFFAACVDFGAVRVGMMTGDAAINRDAPIICCTAEILANLALRGDGGPFDYVVMDEFHYYGDRERGVAWQLPLLLLEQTVFLLMSATLGDTVAIEDSLTARSGREVAVVRSAVRPVPLEFTYSEKAVHEMLSELLRNGRAPVYLVCFTQREAAEQAQALLSVDFLEKEDKARIAAAVGHFRFDTPFGKDISRLIKHGLGIHHAGLLPKYRLLIEQLSQQGLLQVICGTDTLGVGVNVPIRTVLFTKLCKFDGERTAIVTVRDFKQIAGRAGRKGFDDRGYVVVQAPEHVIENKRLEARAGNDPAKKKKLVKKKPPDRNYVPWDESTMRGLIEKQPEALESRFEVSHAMILNLLQGHTTRRGGGYRMLIDLIERSHERAGMKGRHRRRAAQLFRSLRHAGIVSLVRNVKTGTRVVIDEELQRDFSLNHTLSLYLWAALETLDRHAPTYALDVVTLCESVLEDPRPVLMAQLDAAKDRRMAELKAEGVEYAQRLEELDKVETPKPNAELIYATFNAFAEKHPWVGRENIRPKSVVREMIERAMTFNDYVREYGLARSEGVLLRYVTDVYKTLVQNVPAAAKTDDLAELQVSLRTLLQVVDTSLVSEWEQLVAPKDAAVQAPVTSGKPRLFDPAVDHKAFQARVRAEVHRLVACLARRDYEQAATLVRHETEGAWTAAQFEAALAPFYGEHRALLFNHEAKLRSRTALDELSPRSYRLRQALVDSDGANDWVLEATIDLTDATSADDVWLQVERIGT